MIEHVSDALHAPFMSCHSTTPTHGCAAFDATNVPNFPITFSLILQFRPTNLSIVITCLLSLKLVGAHPLLPLSLSTIPRPVDQGAIADMQALNVR